MENGAVRSYVELRAHEVLEQFELVLNTVGMEEAAEQAGRGEGALARHDAREGAVSVGAVPRILQMHRRATPRGEAP